MAFGAPGDKATNIILTTTSNTEMLVTFDADHAAGTTDDVQLVFTNKTDSGDGTFTAVGSSSPANATPDLNAQATKTIAYGTAEQVTGVTLTGTYGNENKPENQAGHTITVTATLTDAGD